MSFSEGQTDRLYSVYASCKHTFPGVIIEKSTQEGRKPMADRKQIIFHIDVNSAYLSWSALEKLKNGSDVDLRTIPSIIGGDEKSRHGIVLAK